MPSTNLQRNDLPWDNHWTSLSQPGSNYEALINPFARDKKNEQKPESAESLHESWYRCSPHWNYKTSYLMQMKPRQGVFKKAPYNVHKAYVKMSLVNKTRRKSSYWSVCSKSKPYLCLYLSRSKNGLMASVDWCTKMFIGGQKACVIMYISHKAQASRWGLEHTFIPKFPYHTLMRFY